MGLTRASSRQPIDASVRPYPTVDAADAALRAEEIDALIGDSMALEYHVHHVADFDLVRIFYLRIGLQQLRDALRRILQHLQRHAER